MTTLWHAATITSDAHTGVCPCHQAGADTQLHTMSYILHKQSCSDMERFVCEHRKRHLSKQVQGVS